jgi:hypothetical protein
MKKILTFTIIGGLLINIAPYASSAIITIAPYAMLSMGIIVSLFMLHVFWLSITTGDTPQQSRQRVANLRGGVYGYRGKSL